MTVRSDLLRIEVVDSLAALDRHAQAYDALSEQIDGLVFPVFRREWIRVGRERYLSRGTSLHFLFAWRGEALIGVAPFIRRRRSLGVTAVRSLEFWGQHSGSTAMENFTAELLVADERDRPDCMRAWRAHLIGPARDHWDLIDLEHLCGILPSGRALAECFPEGEVLEEQMPGFLVDLDLGVEALHKAFGKNSTRNLRRSRRLLEEAGTPFRFESRPDIDDPLFDEIGRVHTVRQQELAAKGRTDRDLPFVDPVSRRVLRRALQCEAEAGHLRVHTLRIGERLAAFGLVIQKEARAVFWLIGFDAEFQQFSPSRLLFAEVYGSGMDSRDLRSVNLLLGHTRTKEELSTTRYAAIRFRLVNDWSLRSRLRRGLLERLKRLARTLQRPDRPRRVPSP